MKRIVLFTCIGTLALALTAWGAPRDRQAARSAKGKSASSAHVVSARGGGHVASRATPMRTSRSFSAARSHQRVTATRSRPTSRSFARASTSRSSRMEGARTRSVRTAERAARTRTVTGSRTALNRERNVARANIARSNRAEAARIRSERNLARANSLRTNRAEATRTRNARVAQATRGAARQNLAVNRQRNLTLARNVLRNRTGDVASPTIGEAIVSAARGMLPSTITTERGMTATGGMATARALCSCWAVGGVGMAATGIRPGAMTRMPGIRMMGQSTLGTRI